MPLSKKKQAEYQRDRRKRLKLGMTLISPPQTSKAVIPKSANQPQVDADGNVIPEYD